MPGSMAIIGENLRQLAMTILQILNDGKKLLIGDETKSESLTENLTQKTEDDGMKLSDAEVT